MTNVTEITPTRRTSKFSGAMIEHAIDILRDAGPEYTLLDEHGCSEFSADCVGMLLKDNWDSEVQGPQSRKLWGALGHVAQNIIWIEDDLERDEGVSIPRIFDGMLAAEKVGT